LSPLPPLFTGLSVRRVRPRHRSQLGLPLISIHKQLLLVIQQLLPCLSRVLGIWSLHDGIHRTALLAEAAIDAFRHIDIVARCAAATVRAFLCFNCDGLGWANGFAEFAGDATFFACWVAAEGMLTAEAGGNRAFFKRIVDCVAIVCVSNARVGFLLCITPALYACHRSDSGIFKGGVKGTHGGLKNCSSTTYIPRIISVSKK
jgi:hypothetical protein